MKTRFIKMHGCGNDFVVLDGRADGMVVTPGQAAALADRHTGIGCDQLVVMQATADVATSMRIYNPDGSEAGACGNATRCVADILMREAGRDAVIIRTISGDLPAVRRADGLVEVDMGPPRLGWRDIPLIRSMDTLRLELPGEPAAASMGNPHVTFFTEDVADAARLGPGLERHELFPERANIGFARIIDAGTIRLRVWERGAGLTLACGSGACAALVNAHRRGLAQRRATVIVDGGALQIEWRADGHVLMAGPAVTVFAGEVGLA